ncbi:MAG: hypothetical protein BWZ02_00731 [Lentisphaerae bacterium ADurb.BinA184]|nr:MAG: hypothetical protein BWZ02_00731 [Lentisphaerae bacterium ADurb.BinA184]
MNFGNPLFLWALPAVALPVLLHLFFRRRRTRVEFSTLQFFRVRQRYLAHRRRLREILLLLLRTLALLFIILALARPLLHRSGFSLGARTDAVIILDDSLSMGRKISTGGSALDLARAKALEILDTLREGDGAALVLTSGREGLALTRRRQDVRAAIEAAFLTAASGSFASAVAQAEHALGSSSSPNRELFLISDFQKAQIPAAPVPFRQAGAARVYALPIEGPTDNVSAGPVDLSPRPKSVNHLVTVPVTLVNHGDAERGVDVSLSVNGETVRKDFVSLPPGRPLRHVFEYVPTRAGVCAGYVKVEDEGLEMDNRAPFCFEVVEALNVLLVQSDIMDRSDPFVYLRAALCPPGAEALNGMRAETTYLQELSPARLRDTHVAVLCDPPPLAAATAATLEDFVERGGAVLCFPGPRLAADTFSACRRLPLDGVCGERETVQAKGIELGGPLAGLGDILQLDLLEWRGLHRLAAEPPWRALATVGGRPAIVEAPAGQGRWLFTAFPPRRECSNWPELKSFPVVMIHLVDAAAHERLRTPPLECGKALHATPAGPGPVTVADMAGALPPASLPPDRPVFTETWRPAVLRLDGALERHVVLTANAGESALAAVAPGGAGERVVAARVQTLRTASQIASQIRKYRAGNDLSGIFLVFAVLALTAECLIGNRYGLTGLRGPAVAAGEAPA